MSANIDPSPMQAWNRDDRLQHAALTDIGMRRLNNQDAHAAVLAPDEQAWRSRGHLFIVADGMGAHAAGELASKLAVDGVCHLYLKYSELSPPDALHRALVETNGEIHRRGQANADFHNMGTTASALLLLPQGALAAHVGDSRIYRLRNGCLQQLTRDHSLVWELREQLAENSELSIPKNVITRSLGPNPTVDVDIEGPLPLRVGDTFLLCSDGLTGRVADEELATILAQLAPEEAAHLLIDLANLRGGPDNITVIVAKITGDELATVAAQPLTVGRRHGPATVQSAVWVCGGVCLLGAVVLAIIGAWLPAMCAAAGATAALLTAQISLRRHRNSGVSLRDGQRLGKGPYTETPCPAVERCVIMLRETTGELRATNAQSPSLNWGEFDACFATGQRAEGAQRFADALRDYARAIRALMNQVREQQNKRASDSSLDL